MYLLIVAAILLLLMATPFTARAASAHPVKSGSTVVSLAQPSCSGRNSALAALEYGSLLRPLATNNSIDLRVPGVFPLITIGNCTCGYVDGRFTQTTIPFSGNTNTEQQAWNVVLADYDNASCDGINGVNDADSPVQSTGRDLGTFVVSWDTNFYYGYTVRGGSSTNKNIFFYYADTNNDGKMTTGEPVLVATWQGSNQNVDITRYSYRAENAGGDTLVYTAQPITWNNGKPHTLGSADGYTMPGLISYVGPVQGAGSGGFGFTSGDRMEWRVRWSDLGLTAPTAIRWHISSANSINIPSQVDDNMGGCGACAGSTQYGGADITGTNTVNTTAGSVVYLAHTVQNTGNGNDTLNLDGSYSGAWAPYSFQFYRDVNGNGVYDAGDTLLTDTNGDGTPDTGLLAPNATIKILTAVTLPGTAAGTSTITTTATSSFQQCNSPKAFQNISDSVTVPPTLSGFVYSDANHNATREATGENGTGVTLYAKLAPATGNATQAVAVNPTTGAYTFSVPSAGNYRVIIDNNNTLTDTTPWVPTANWTPTENPSGVITVTAGVTSITGQNFGFYNGVKVTGTVFKDDGASGMAVANDGVQQASESGLQNFTLTATNGGATTYATATTDASGAYTLWIPAGATTVQVAETVPSGYVTISAAAGNTGGTAPSATMVSFTDTGIQYTNVNFAAVPQNIFGSNLQNSGNPGEYVYYPHTLQTGSGGVVRFSTSSVATPAFAGFTQTVYRDINCNGVIDSGEDVNIAGQPTVVTSGVVICIIVGDFIPAGVPRGTQNIVTVSAQFSYQPSTVSMTQTVTDTTSVTGTALALSKSVDKANALPGATLTYTIMYKNNSTGPITGLYVMDTTPLYTKFQSATCVLPLPANVTACALSAPPFNGTGVIQWSMSGSLAPGASGTLTFVVQIAN